jgi:tetratricopeptide (TPR) repeat protein
MPDGTNHCNAVASAHHVRSPRSRNARNGHARFAFVSGLLSLLVFIVPNPLVAQAPGSFGGILGPESLNTTSITVEVRGADGSKLSSMAIVNLSNAFGQLVQSQTTFGSQTVFQAGAGAYAVEVEAFGYEKARVQTEVSSAKPHLIVVVTLKPDKANGLNYPGTSHVTLSVRTQKEMAKAVEKFQANQFDEAIRHLETARQLAPRYSDATYMMALAYEKKNDFAKARKYWEVTLEVEPKHVPSLLAIGETLLSHEDITEARQYLDKAVEIAPNSWKAHSLLAAALLHDKLYAEAVTHAQRALELGKTQASSSLLVLGQALASERQNEQAITVLTQYLATKPSERTAEAVQKLIAKIKETTAETARGGISYENVIANDASDAPLTAAALSWMPANVDDGVPPVEPGVSCSLDEVIKKTSMRVAELPALVDRYTATEVLHHEELNNAGYPEHVEDLSFNYVASVREIRSKFGEFLDVQEYRNGSTGTDMFPDKMASTGLPSVVLIFHPWLAPDFDMVCEGLSRTDTGFAWQVHFSQKKDKESRIRQYRMGGHVHPVSLKGRAWIDANTFEVVRLETDLRESHPDFRLNAEHLVMEYRPVQFKSRKEELWLPASADYYAIFRGHKFHRRHAFAEYILFAVEDKQKLGEPNKGPSD